MPFTETTTQETQTTFLEKLVQDKGEQWKDPEVIAKGKIEADALIESLKRENSELKEDMSKQDYAKTLLEQIQSKAAAAPATTEQTTTPSSTSSESTPLSESDIGSLIEQTLTKRETERTVNGNLLETDKLLAEKFGTDADNKVAERAKALGFSMDRMKDIAGESPTAFMTLMGEAPQKQTNQTPTSTTNTENGKFVEPAQRDWAFYQNLRKTNSKLYYSPKVQKEIHENWERIRPQ